MNYEYETLFKKIIIERGLSYNIVSRMTGIPKSTIGNYAVGIRIPDLKTALKLTKTLQISTDLLYVLFEPCN